MKRTTTTLAPALLLALSAFSALAACGTADDADDGDGGGDREVTLVTHDSFAVSDAVLARFTDQTGYTVNVLRGGDAGVMVNQAILSKDNPQGDVLFGVDSTLLSRALDEDLFIPYQARGLDQVPEEVRLDPDEHRVTPVDTGDVCINYDRAYFADHDLAPPQTFADLADPAYRDLLVVENAATSSPGLAFLLATVAAHGEDGWEDYWQRLADNGVEVVDGWEQAYNERFSGAGNGGDKPLVVSYATSPPVELVYGDPPLAELTQDEWPDQAPTGVATGTCYRQIEFAGLLTGAANPEGGRALLDFLLSRAFQEDMPLSMFVNPVRADAALPEAFTRYAGRPEDPETLAPETIADNREQWIDAWTSLVLR
jgi:thiamine transport system substrate-binding protein